MIATIVVWSPLLSSRRKFDGLESIKHGHIEINHDQTRMIAPRHVEGLLSVFSFKNAVPFHSKARLSIMRGV